MLVETVVRKCVVFLGVGMDADFRPMGTGFIVSHQDRGFIVTARHVIAGISSSRRNPSKAITIRLNKEGGGTECRQFQFSEWRLHPNERETLTDTAVLPAPWLDRGKYIFSHVGAEGFATDKLLIEWGVNIGDEVFLAGLFTNHHGDARNIPVVRIGNIAAMPDEPIKTKLGYLRNL